MNINTVSSLAGDVTQLSVVKKSATPEAGFSGKDESPPVQTGAKPAQAGVINPKGGNAPTDAEKSTPEQVDKAVSDVNSFFQNERRELSFTINKAVATGVVIEIKDTKTQKVIQQIPPESVVKLAERLNELNGKDDGVSGVFLKELA
ncbi:MAG: hypothetical protein CVV13_14100 [Gammaproteobacteria bacterium HGW-Gammaproteobacteria-3]|nr:MAG: hypothetical protein CVV13_14100 [Gammaproteobacteria bacterium HGW-Gammaproteobacteria-3]